MSWLEPNGERLRCKGAGDSSQGPSGVLSLTCISTRNKALMYYCLCGNYCISTSQGKFRLVPHAFRWLEQTQPRPQPMGRPCTCTPEVPADADYLLGNFSGGTKPPPLSMSTRGKFPFRLPDHPLLNSTQKAVSQANFLQQPQHPPAPSHHQLLPSLLQPGISQHA